MPDQADQLRQLVNGAGAPCALEAQSAPAMVLVAGGRAGVGTTTVAVNLAAVLAARQDRVLVVDAVEERPNVLGVAGVRRAGEHCLADVLSGACEITDAFVEGPGGVRVLSPGRNAARGGSGLRRNASAHNHLSRARTFEFRRDLSTRAGANRREPAQCGRGELQRLMRGLDSLRGEVDVIVVDAGAGLSAWSRRFWLRATLVVLVTTAEGPALLDAYAMLKRSVAGAAGPDVRLLVNNCENERQGRDAQRRFSSACEKFLGRPAPGLPMLPRCEDASVRRALRVWEEPDTDFGHAMMWMGRAVGDALRLEDAGCGVQGFANSSFPVSFVPQSASLPQQKRVG